MWDWGFECSCHHRSGFCQASFRAARSAAIVPVARDFQFSLGDHFAAAGVGRAGQRGLEGRGAFRADLAEEAGVRFGKQEHHLRQVAFPGHVGQREPGAQFAGEGHLGGGHGQPAFDRSWQARTSPASIAPCNAAKTCGPARGRPAAPCRRKATRSGRSGSRPARPASGPPGRRVARLLQVHRHAAAHVVDLPRALISSDGGMEIGSAPGRNSLLRLSLPLMNGVPSAMATS